MSLETMFEVAGKSVIVTGAAYGLGRAYAEVMAERGANVTLIDLNEDQLARTLAECNSAVAASHGMSEAFSTGSQNHQPPQPSS